MSWWSIINCERVQSQRCGNDAGMTVLVQWQENDYGIDLCCLFVYARGILAALVGLARCRVVVGSGNGREREVWDKLACQGQRSGLSVHQCIIYFWVQMT